jgi:hypothetical protein
MLLVRVPESNLRSFMAAVVRLYRERVPLTVLDMEKSDTVKLRARDGAPLGAVLHDYQVSVRGVKDEDLVGDPRFADLIAASRTDLNDLRYGMGAVFPFERASIIASMLVITGASAVSGDLVTCLRNNNKYTALMGANITPAIATVVGKSVSKRLAAIPSPSLLDDSFGYNDLDHITLRHANERGLIGVFELGSLIKFVRFLADEYKVQV